MRRLTIVLATCLAAALAPIAGGGPSAEGGERMKAPELDGAEAWINSPGPVRLADLKGKAVLLDFWTYG
jgi:hypothetical protein